MELPIELDRIEVIVTLGLLRNPSSYQFIIIKGTCIQKPREPKTLLLIKVTFFIFVSIFGPFASVSPNKCVCGCSVEQSESVSSSCWQRFVAGRAVIVY